MSTSSAFFDASFGFKKLCFCFDLCFFFFFALENLPSRSEKLVLRIVLRACPDKIIFIDEVITSALYDKVFCTWV